MAADRQEKLCEQLSRCGENANGALGACCQAGQDAQVAGNAQHEDGRAEGGIDLLE